MRVSESFTLANDMTCAGDGMVIVADNLTVDLGGHTLTGPGMGPQTWPLPQLDSVGVRVGGHTGVTIRNGKTTAFSTGIYFIDMVSSSIESVTTLRNRFGFYIHASQKITVKDSDIEWERMRAGGAGGQKVNKTESAVRIWYKKGTPDEMEVKCQDERSQHKNRERAMRVLRARLYEHAIREQQQELAADRRAQVGSGERSEKVRTYNFPQGRVTDHRIKLTAHNLDQVLEGDLDEFTDALSADERRQKLEATAA